MNETIETQNIEIIFPLTEHDLINILKGIEYNSVTMLADGRRIQVKVCSKDRTKIISHKKWGELLYLAHSNPDLMNLIRDLDSE